MAKTNRISANPENAEKGGGLGFPQGEVVTLTECRAGRWEEAGEKAIKGGRDAEDPALILTGEVESKEEPITVFLSAGKANRIVASDDGEYFEPAEGSSAKGLNDSCNATLFLASLTDKKRQGKLALNGELFDEGFSNLVGLQFRAGYEVLQRDMPGDDEGGKKKARPHLIAEEIVAAPKGAKGGKSAGKSKKAADEDEDEDERPAKKGGKGKSKGNDAEAMAERAVVEALGNPKYRKGLPMNKVYSAVFNSGDVRESDEKDAILEFAQDEEWLQDSARPWTYDGDEEMIQALAE